MKEKLEYKILKYLSDNEDGSFLDISHLSENSKLLKSKIYDFKQRDFIKTKPYPQSVSTSGGLIISSSRKPPKCKITSQGNEYLLKIEKDFNIEKVENNTINYNLENNKNTQIIHESERFKNEINIKAKPAPYKNIESGFRKFTKDNPFIIGLILVVIASIIGLIIANS